MSGKKTRHLKGFIIEGGVKYVYSRQTQVFHCRPPCDQYSGQEWQRLVDSVSAGSGADLGLLMESTIRNKIVTLVMG